MAYFNYEQIAPASVPTPSAGRSHLFYDSTTGNWAHRNDAALVTQLTPQVYAPERVYHVAKSGASYTTIKLAHDAITALVGGDVPSANNPAIIFVHVGDHEIDNSLGAFTPQAHVIVGGHLGTVIRPSNDNLPMIELANAGTGVNNCLLQGNTKASGGIGITCSSDTDDISLDGCILDNWDIAVKATGSSASVGTIVDFGRTTLEDNSTHFSFDTVNKSGGHGIITHLDREKLVFGPNTVINGLAMLEENDEFGVFSPGELIVGQQGAGQGLHVGEGDPTHVGTAYKTNTNLEDGASWNDITNSIKTSATTGMLAATWAGSCLYVGASVPLKAVKFDVSTALVLGAGELVLEYWDGAAWSSIKHMTLTVADGLQRANELLETTGVQYLLLENPSTSFATKLLDGDTKYWVRIRVTATITTSSVAAKHGIKNAPSGAHELSDFGQLRIGTHQWQQSVSDVHLRLTDDVAGASPANENILVSSEVRLTPVDNEFQNGANDRIGGSIRIPKWFDTSKPLKFEINWAVIGTATGDVEWELITSPAGIGDILKGALAQVTLASIEAVDSSADDVIKQVTFDVDVSSLSGGDVLYYVIKRDATGGNPDDTLTGNVYISSLFGEATSFR